MGFLRPATPGFIVTLIATILLAVVSFCVPYFKSIYFLKAVISVSGLSGNITFGTLGYCLELTNGTTCSKPSIGYQLDINSLVGNKLPVEIPQVAVKWLTYALFLHVVALILSAGSAVFGLLAHVREMSMTCCSTFISGFAASVAMIAFIFDIALFFVAKARINAIGSAQIGNAIWLTLAAWILLFFSGCFYTLGRCCLNGRAPRGDKRDWGRKDPEAVPPPSNGYAEQLRLDAVKAEADRKARQKAAEGGLPAFYETQPLTGRVEGDHVYIDDDSVPAPSSPGGRPGQGGHYPAGGYVPGQPGSRTVDDYYNTSHPNTSGSTTTYPPQPNQPHRQNSTHTGYAPSSYGNTSTASSPPPHQPHRQASGYNVNAGYGAPSLTSSPPPTQQYLATPHQYNADPYANSGYDYGHTAGGTSYHTAASHGQQQPSSYSQYDPYNPQPQGNYVEPSFNPETYNNTSQMVNTAVGYSSTPNQYYGSSSPAHPQPERSYTLGGDGYGASTVRPLAEHNAAYYPYGGEPTATSVPPIDTNVGTVPVVRTSPVKGPRSHLVVLEPPHEDLPPGYEPGSSNVVGQWGKR
ncbi:uncharacterized protein LACBIDRAFT_291721 [Laccaria bicolor S238N-H82]|uniref:Predicted protein n=1 Tax=Laccaria bicolor (strain S238N-H82 / ATCC MYA-4686) TaxID=486041 RepID=B0CRN0_LACBS|nr:uncharacterized protein LACBIDRAFT_291721 [Laccaria bicolor S238N-H82]EDR15231.1 predicted protein [Laccaria bicolor S238N-H82]|eukprot:XP_001873439.1 predicted protein [Laccaria bicolor S238N-H82]